MGKWWRQSQIHLVSWEINCKPKEHGGLGFKNIKTQPDLLSKVGMISYYSSPLWMCILEDKYNCGVSYIPTLKFKPKQWFLIFPQLNSSLNHATFGKLWSTIGILPLATWYDLSTMGITRFWTDKWIAGRDSLESLVLNGVPQLERIFPILAYSTP